MNDRAFNTIKQLQALITSKEVSPRELICYFIERMQCIDMQLKSALEVFTEDSVVDTIGEHGSLAGIPGLIKDNILMKGRKATAGSKILEGFVSPYDATVSERLKALSAPLIGRANMDEFAMGSSTETSAFQKTKNPWDMSRVPGGSSGGSAAAVAAGLVPWALGTDTGGSVRQPAAFCGIVGMRPTYGLVSRYGVIAYGSSLDQVGPLTRTVYDNALILQSIAGHDIKDATSLSVETPDYVSQLEHASVNGMRIGVVQDALYAQGIDPEIQAAVEEAIKIFESLGAQIKKINLPTLDYSAAAYFIISRAEAASNLARFDGVRYGMRDKQAHTLNEMYERTRHDGFGAEVKSRIMVGNYTLSAGHADAFYDNARKVRRIIRKDFAQAFKDVDLLIMPTHATPAFTFGAYDVDKLQMDLQDYYTCPANLAGIPAISLPCGFTRSNLPIGLQILGPHLSEQLMYKAAHVYEQATEWHTMHPEL